MGGPIDTLIDYIDQNEPDLKYFLCTHNHPDHIIGIPDIRDRFPGAKTVIHKLDYHDLLVQKEYVLENADAEFIEWLNSDPELKKFLESDLATFGEPDIYPYYA